MKRKRREKMTYQRLWAVTTMMVGKSDEDKGIWKGDGQRGRGRRGGFFEREK